MERLMLRVRRLQIGFSLSRSSLRQVAIWDLVTGGFYFQLLGIRVSSREVHSPFRIALLAAVAVIQLNDSRSAPAAASWNVIVRWARWIALALAIASMALRGPLRHLRGRWRRRAYGYVSQAELFAAGHLSAPRSVGRGSGHRRPRRGAARLSAVANARWIVPTYPAGLPDRHGCRDSDRRSDRRVFRHSVVRRRQRVLRHLLGVRITDARAGLIAAVLVTFSPIFVFQSLRADERCACHGVVAACVTAPLPAPGRHWALGMCVSAAVLARPNLAPLAAVLALVVASHGRGVPRAPAFRRRSDSWVSGRGGAQQFLVRRPAHLRLWPAERSVSQSRAIPNIRNYWSWLIELETGVTFCSPPPRRLSRAPGAPRRPCCCFASRCSAATCSTSCMRHVAVSPLPAAGNPAPSRARRRDDPWPSSSGCRSVSVGTMLFLICILAPLTYLLTANRLHVFRHSTVRAPGTYRSASTSRERCHRTPSC